MVVSYKCLTVSFKPLSKLDSQFSKFESFFDFKNCFYLYFFGDYLLSNWPKILRVSLGYNYKLNFYFLYCMYDKLYDEKVIINDVSFYFSEWSLIANKHNKFHFGLDPIFRRSYIYVCFETSGINFYKDVINIESKTLYVLIMDDFIFSKLHFFFVYLYYLIDRSDCGSFDNIYLFHKFYVTRVDGYNLLSKKTKEKKKLNYIHLKFLFYDLVNKFNYTKDNKLFHLNSNFLNNSIVDLFVLYCDYLCKYFIRI